MTLPSAAIQPPTTTFVRSLAVSAASRYAAIANAPSTTPSDSSDRTLPRGNPAAGPLRAAHPCRLAQFPLPSSSATSRSSHWRSDISSVSEPLTSTSYFAHPHLKPLLFPPSSFFLQPTFPLPVRVRDVEQVGCRPPRVDATGHQPRFVLDGPRAVLRQHRPPDLARSVGAKPSVRAEPRRSVVYCSRMRSAISFRRQKAEPRISRLRPTFFNSGSSSI